ncbi:hypothetical protein JOC78_000417 [Bacillus ectoiniformans]|uniref:hypothetical protein n=1 Tax=Bacillus ectoiniformans TaxID=1494429 RepID=UPI00195BA87B|nr:hypothetical protein [Bacillus ectoiniformans]MBM7647496.1 hypothetical protein [Bacillus ectoiniformans]
MEKLLFFGPTEKARFLQTVRSQLETKNRLLGLIIRNPDHKTSLKERQRKINRYEQQIYLLQQMLLTSEEVKDRSGLKKLNHFISAYRAIE